MSKRFYGSYEGKAGREAQEASDGGMIPSGQGSFANMPTTLVMREWGKTQVGMPENINDGMSGIDSQIGADNSKKNAHMLPKKV